MLAQDRCCFGVFMLAAVSWRVFVVVDECMGGVWYISKSIFALLHS